MSTIIDWKRLLSSVQVPWIDRGPNTSPGRVNISCPFCRNDPSYHMSIDLNGAGYYCYRRPQHGGKNYTRLLVSLGIDRYSAIELQNKYHIAEVVEREDHHAKVNTQTVSKQWNTFASAVESKDCLDYLEFERDFPDPHGICLDYDLRFADRGKWARRLLIPMKNRDGLIGFTGRSLDSFRNPRYLNSDSAGTGAIYLPTPVNENLLIVEGPLDALKVSAAMKGSSWSVLALTGKNFNDDRLLTIKHYASTCKQWFLALDSEVAVLDAIVVQKMLCLSIGAIYNARLLLPGEYSDPGEMSFSAVRRWLGNIGEYIQ